MYNDALIIEEQMIKHNKHEEYKCARARITYAKLYMDRMTRGYDK